MNWREELKKDYEKKFGLITAGDITLKYTSPKRMWEWITNNIESLLKQQREICAEIYLKKSEYDYYKLQSNQIAVCIGRDKILNAPEPGGDKK